LLPLAAEVYSIFEPKITLTYGDMVPSISVLWVKLAEIGVIFKVYYIIVYKLYYKLFLIRFL